LHHFGILLKPHMLAFASF